MTVNATPRTSNDNHSLATSSSLLQLFRAALQAPPNAAFEARLIADAIDAVVRTALLEGLTSTACSLRLLSHSVRERAGLR